MAKPYPPAIFKWRHFAPEVILCAVRWYLRYSLSYRDVQELLVERGVEIDHTTVWRWVQHYAPELEERTRPHLKSTNKSWPWMRPTCESRAAGFISIEPLIRRERRSISSCRRFV